jgi:hypothetical protein
MPFFRTAMLCWMLCGWWRDSGAALLGPLFHLAKD